MSSPSGSGALGELVSVRRASQKSRKKWLEYISLDLVGDRERAVLLRLAAHALNTDHPYEELDTVARALVEPLHDGRRPAPTLALDLLRESGQVT